MVLRQLRVGKHSLGRSLTEDPSLRDDNDLVGILRHKVDLVLNQNDRAARLLQRGNDAKYTFRSLDRKSVV